MRNASPFARKDQLDGFGGVATRSARSLITPSSYNAKVAERYDRLKLADTRNDARYHLVGAGSASALVFRRVSIARFITSIAYRWGMAVALSARFSLCVCVSRYVAVFDYAGGHSGGRDVDEGGQT